MDNNILFFVLEALVRAFEENWRQRRADFNQLRRQVYELVRREASQQIPKPEFENKLRQRWNEQGGGAVYAGLKNTEKLLALIRLLWRAAETWANNKPIPPLPDLCKELEALLKEIEGGQK